MTTQHLGTYGRKLGYQQICDKYCEQLHSHNTKGFYSHYLYIDELTFIVLSSLSESYTYILSIEPLMQLGFFSISSIIDSSIVHKHVIFLFHRLTF